MKIITGREVHMMNRTTSTLLLVAMVTACGGAAPDDTTADAAASAAERQPQSAPAPATTAVERPDYALTMPAVQRWYDAQAGVYRAIRDNPGLVEELEFLGRATDIDEVEAHFDGIPEWRDAVSEAGLDMRDYAAILITLFHAKAADEAIQDGADRARTITDREVDPRNLEFVEQNRDELERLERELAQMAGLPQ
jgi:hypothetical protein